MGAFHALAKGEDIFCQQFFVFRLRQIEVAPEIAGDLVDEFILLFDRLDILKHGLALMRVDAEGRDHVEERVGVNVFLVGVTAENEFQLRGGHEFADDVLDVVTDNALGGGEIANAHADDPAFDVADGFLIAPLLDILAHRDILWLPVVGLHRFVEVVGPLVFERENVKIRHLATVDDFLRGERGFRFVLIEHERLIADGE